MEKYIIKLISNVKVQLGKWLGSNQPIEKEELERFLHSFAGTSKTLGLMEIGEHAAKKLETLEQLDKNIWTNLEVKDYLMEIIKYCYNEEIVPFEKDQTDKNANQSVVLIIDEDPSLLMNLKEELEHVGYYVLVASSVDKALPLFYEIKPDCLITDLHTKDKNGVETLVLLKERLFQLFIPAIGMSDDHSLATRVRAYRRGATDFIPKPFDIQELIAKVDGHIERKRHIEKIVLSDELTQVYNRKFFNSAFEQQIAEFTRSSTPFCLAIIDIDNFKRVNDTYGHIVGDEVLKQFASYVKVNVRKGDVLARYGGEEFALLLPDTELEEGAKLLERLLVGFSTRSFSANTNSFSCTFSVGIVQVNEMNESLTYWVEKADGALYEAKQTGKAKVVKAINETRMELKKLKLAIIDDDPIIRTMLSEVLQNVTPPRSFEIELHMFSDGVSFLASDWINDDVPYFVILDGMMPKMDGLEVLQKLRKERKQSQFTVMMLTTRKSENDIKRALQLGADDYMTKPFKLVELEMRVERLLKRVKE